MLPPTLDPELSGFWQAFCAAHGTLEPSRFYEAFRFSDNPADADALAELVMRGDKRGTATLAWSNEHYGIAAPTPGALSIVLDARGQPVCVIETVTVEVTPFDAVSAAFAQAEGEGDKSLAHWRSGHWDYFARECARIGRTPAPDMPVVCETFRVLAVPF